MKRRHHETTDEQITLPKTLLQHVFDIAVSSMDFGSGFLDDEEQENLRELARAIGIDPMEATQLTHRCKYRAKLASVEQPIHNLTDWIDQVVPFSTIGGRSHPWKIVKSRVRYCMDCNGGREEMQVEERIIKT